MKSTHNLPITIAIAGLCLNAAAVQLKADDQSECVKPVDTTFGNQLLTREEKIEILNQRFFDALVRFEECMNEDEGAAQGSAESGGGGGSGGSQTFAAPVESVAVTSVQGTQAPDPSEIPDSAFDSTVTEGEWMVPDENEPMANGKMPEELEVTDNDAVLLEQIRQAAVAETDPVLKEKLWQEYRRRSGNNN